MVRKPDYYKTPLRSREAIVDFCIDAARQRGYDHRPHPFCFNVKAWGTDLSFDHLLEIFRKDVDNYPWLGNEDWLQAAREKFEELDQNDLWEWGREGACGLVTDSDCYNHLWDGTPVDVEYSFEGRSGGWISLNSFDGVDFTNRDYGDIRELLLEQDYAWLRRFYQLIVMLKHDFTTEAAVSEIEHHAAFCFVENCCHGIPKPDARQLRLPFMKKEAG